MAEAFYNDKMQPVVDELRAKHLLTLSEGAYVVDLSADNMPPCIILKSDGTTLYATRDLAAAFYRKKTYDFAKCLYVVAYQQNLHFRQWFKVVEKMGYDWAKDLEHVAFGMVSMADGTHAFHQKGPCGAAQGCAAQRHRARGRNFGGKNLRTFRTNRRVAEQVGVGAVVFGVLYNARIKDIAFSYDRALSFEGILPAYLQYTGARCCSVLRKADPAWQEAAAGRCGAFRPVCHGRRARAGGLEGRRGRGVGEKRAVPFEPGAHRAGAGVQPVLL